MKEAILKLSRLEKLKLIGLCIKAFTAIVGGSLVLTEGHPYLSLATLALGAVANEVVVFITEKENKALDLKNKAGLLADESEQ